MQNNPNDQVKKYARRAAISAVVCRNLAHNTGSHKAPWLKFFVNDRFERFYHYLENSDKNNLTKLNRNLLEKKHDFENCVNSDDEGLKKDKLIKIEDAKTEQLQESLAIQSYFDFFSANMEFITDVTMSFDTERSSFEGTLNDIIEEYFNKNLALSGLIDDYYFTEGLDAPQRKVTISGYSKISDFTPLSLPNGSLSKVAIMIIFENLIRNVYKHLKIREKIEIGFQLSDFDEHYYALDIFHKSEYANNSLKRIQNFVDSPILNNDYSIRQEGWGIFEMKVCAAYLVDFPLDYIDNVVKDSFVEISEKGKFHPLLTPNYYSLDDNSYKISQDELTNLGFRIYLKRPKRIFIDEDLLPSFKGKNIGKGILLGKISDVSKSFFNTYDLVLAHKIKAQYLDTNQRLLFVDDSTYAFEYENHKGHKSSFIFSVWLQKVIDDDRIKSLSEILWVNYLKQKQYKIKHSDFKIARNEDRLKKIKEQNPDIQPHQLIIIDGHGRDVVSIGKKNHENLKSFLWYIPEDFQIRQTWFTNVFPSGDFDFNYNFQEKLYLTETLNIHIGIFDERVQFETLTEYRNNTQLTIADLLDLSGIHILSNKIWDLVKISEDNFKELEHLIKESLKTNEYTILHYTIFERLASFNNHGNDTASLTSYYKSLIKDAPNLFVFCSGRGRPSNLIRGCYYIHLSTLRDLLIRLRSKYHLVQALKSLRQIFH
ncbi:hypothetical protein EGI22_15995 [Lacihabitans sp. LS3-19]|uniref:hypothetical protein n=1 Tax=Lacihabitans sp. LS3-19 TaxID=2487335 RepID=UPI0020CC7A2D|nr:hypothetical protein [Lacihabitans sp. LS3-19]MCP9769405.1 hypothetical protein [Lacihabitans sp. LS3-19]